MSNIFILNSDKLYQYSAFIAAACFKVYWFIDFEWLLDFYSVTTTVLIVSLICEISQHLLDGMASFK